MLNYLVVDTETGGLDANRHSLLEVALVAYRQGEIIGRRAFYIKEDEYHVTPRAMEINGLRLDRVAAEGIHPAQAVEAINNFVAQYFRGTKDFMIMGQNVAFDVSYLKKLYARFNHDMDDYISYRKFDTSTLLATAKALGVLPMDAPGSLHNLADYLGIAYDSSHAALADAELTIKVYEYIMQLLGGNIHGKEI